MVLVVKEGNHRAGFGLAIIALILLLAACERPSAPPGWAQAFLTRDRTDATTATRTGPSTLEIRAPHSNVGTNSRALLWDLSQPLSVDHHSCVSTTLWSPLMQEGAAVRVGTRMVNGVETTRAITVTKNVVGAADWHYNVHLWDTAALQGRNKDDLIITIASFDRSAAVRADKSRGGRRLCVRVEKNRLEFKVWPIALPEPAWTDPRFTAHVVLPRGWVYESRPGAYIGHLHPGWATHYAISGGVGAPGPVQHPPLPASSQIPK